MGKMAVVMSCEQMSCIYQIYNIMGLKGGQFVYKHAVHNCSSLDVRVQDVAWKIAINLSLQKIIENKSVSNRANIGKC